MQIARKKPVSSFVRLPLWLRAYYAEQEQIENAKVRRRGVELLENSRAWGKARRNKRNGRLY
jgi:hypothetical protein